MSLSKFLFTLHLLLIAEHVPTASGLRCEWQTGSGIWLDPKFGTYLKLNIPKNITECKHQCMTQTTFICVAINYNDGRDNNNCEILAETSQTATKRDNDLWNYHLRPSCAGFWKPWSTSEDPPSPHSNYTDGDNKLKDCMSSCLRDNGTDDQSCRAIVKSRNRDPNRCDLVNTNYGNTISYNRLFHRPSWYLDDSPGATQTEVKNFGAGDRAFMLLTSYTIKTDGYLVAWKYYIGRRANYCESHAGVWRRDGDTYMKITGTLLTPENSSTGGVRFQYVQNATTPVRKGDFLVVYVGNSVGCDGNLVSFKNSGSGVTSEKVYEDARDATDRHPTTLTSTQLKEQDRKVAVKAYVAEYRNLDKLPSTSHPESLSAGKILLSWQVPAGASDENLPGPLYIRVECSISSSFNLTIECQDVLTPIEDTQTTLTLSDIRQPYYARVQIIRNYNQQHLMYSQQHAVNNNTAFCAGRGQLKQTMVNISEGGILKPGEPRMILVSIPSIEDDHCLSATITRKSNLSVIQNQVNRWSFDMAQGMTFRLGVELNVLGGHRTVTWNKKDYTTQRAPPAPEGLTVVSRANTSAELTWSSTEYTNEYASITGYEVECFVSNDAFNKQAAFKIYQNTEANSTGLNLEALYSQVEYTCRVKALLPSDGFGESSEPVIFWTRPALTSGASLPAVIGGAVGGLVAVIVVVIIIIFIQKRSTKRLSSEGTALSSAPIESASTASSTLAAGGESYERLAVRDEHRYARISLQQLSEARASVIYQNASLTLKSEHRASAGNDEEYEAVDSLHYEGPQVVSSAEYEEVTGPLRK